MSETERLQEVARWLRYAEEDLATAQAIVKQGLGVPRQACWLSQQAGEKAIKAALVFQQIEFPRSHDLDLLARLLPLNWQSVLTDVDLSELSQWAVESRYPGDWPELFSVDAVRALEMAALVVDHVRRRVVLE